MPPWNVTSFYNPNNQRKKKKTTKPYVVTDFFNPNNQPGRAATRAVATRTGADSSPWGGAGAGITGAVAAATGNPWDMYLKQIDAREQAAMDRALRSRHQQALDYMGALRGFGSAISGSEADAWGRVLGDYDRAAGATGAFQQGVADDYTMGLRAANEQIARDFAAVGQGGPADIRDTGAATQQVSTVGGENPAATMGLVGENWKNYAGTRPGTLDFMTQQNLMQAQREGLAAEDQIRNEFQQMMADNPQQAMAMWQAVEEFNTAKDEREAKAASDKIATQIALSKEGRESKAFELQVQQYNLKYGDAMADRANDLSKTTGFVHIWDPKTRRFKNTGMKTEERRQADQQAMTTQRGQDVTAQGQMITQANNLSKLRGSIYVYDPKTKQFVDTGIETKSAESDRLNRNMRQAGIDLDERGVEVQEAKLKQTKKNGGYTTHQKRLWGKEAGKAAYSAYYGIKDKTGKQISPPQRPEQVVRYLRAQGIPLSIVLNAVMQYARMPGSNWKYARGWMRR